MVSQYQDSSVSNSEECSNAGVILINPNNDLRWNEIYPQIGPLKAIYLLMQEPNLEMNYPECVINYAFCELVASNFPQHFRFFPFESIKDFVSTIENINEENDLTLYTDLELIKNLKKQLGQEWLTRWVWYLLPGPLNQEMLSSKHLDRRPQPINFLKKYTLYFENIKEKYDCKVDPCAR